MTIFDKKVGPTPTPWRVFTTTDGLKLVGIGSLEGEGILDRGFGVWAWNDPEGIANANLVVEAVNSHASRKERIAELESNEKAYEEIIGPMTYQEVADRIRELEAALDKVIGYCDAAIHPSEQYRDERESLIDALQDYPDAIHPKDTAP